MAVKLKKCPRGRELAKLVPHPRPDANKYSRGRLTVVGGSAAYPGAACLAAGAALRMGAGYVEVVCAPESLPVVHGYLPDLVARSWEGWTPSASKLDDPDGSRPAACLVGCGLPGRPDEVSRVVEVLRLCQSPVVVDGGAIAALAAEGGRAAASLRAEAALATVVTPHWGEAARLGEPVGAKAPRKPAGNPKECARFAQQLADAYGATVVLKGPDTYIARAQMPHDGSDDVVRVMDFGTAALAKAGTGDVLAGMVGALLAQGMAPAKAAQLGCALHALAAAEAAERLTDVSVCASDVSAAIPQAIASVC